MIGGPGLRGPHGRWCRLLALVVTGGASSGPSVAHADGAVSYEVRQQVTGMLLQTHDYGVNGTCSTGTDVAPASVFAQGGSGRGEGLGVGVGGRVGYRYATKPPDETDSTWWGLRLAAGFDVDLLYAKVPTGIPDASGQLCERLRSEGAPVQYRGSSVLLAQFPMFLGAELGLRSPGESDNWHGVILGAGWAPAITAVKPWVTDGDLDASYLGAELTVDFATLRQGTIEEEGKRVALFFLLPSTDRGPVVLTLSFGVVWH